MISYNTPKNLPEIPILQSHTIPTPLPNHLQGFHTSMVEAPRLNFQLRAGEQRTSIDTRLDAIEQRLFRLGSVRHGGAAQQMSVGDRMDWIERRLDELEMERRNGGGGSASYWRDPRLGH